MPLVGPIWETQPVDEAAAKRLAAALDIAPIVAQLLCQRGLDDPDRAARFLHPSLDHLHDPMALADMPVAVDRLLGAIARNERIAVHGDYDVDGITATVILRRPCLPAFLDWLTVRDLRVGQSKLDLMFRRHESSVAVNLLHREGSAEVEVML